MSPAERRLFQNFSGSPLRYDVSVMNEVSVDDSGADGCWLLSTIDVGTDEDYFVDC